MESTMSKLAASVLLATCVVATQASYAQAKVCIGPGGTKTFTDAACPQGTVEAEGRRKSADSAAPPKTLEQQRAEVIKSWDRQIEAKVKEGKVPGTSRATVTLPPRLAQPMQIPRSAPGDKGIYQLLGVRATGATIVALHSRTGPSGIGYSLTETNCSTRQMLEHGYTEEAPEQMKMSATKWFDLVPGSSKSDLATFVCAKFR